MTFLLNLRLQIRTIISPYTSFSSYLDEIEMTDARTIDDPILLITTTLDFHRSN